jgi:hypothetical protein
MYRKIKELPSVAVLYGRLVRAKVLTAAEVATRRRRSRNR